MSNLTITNKSAAAYRNRSAMRQARERLAFAASCDSGLDAINRVASRVAGFVNRFKIELAIGSIAGLGLFVAGCAANLI